MWWLNCVSIPGEGIQTEEMFLRACLWGNSLIVNIGGTNPLWVMLLLARYVWEIWGRKLHISLGRSQSVAVAKPLLGKMHEYNTDSSLYDKNWGVGSLHGKPYGDVSVESPGLLQRNAWFTFALCFILGFAIGRFYFHFVCDRHFFRIRKRKLRLWFWFVSEDRGNGTDYDPSVC